MNTWVSFQSAEQPLLGQFSVSGNSFTMREEIARYLKGRSRIIGRLALEKDRHLVDDDYLSWIEKRNKRQYEWLRKRIEDITEFRSLRGQLRRSGHLTGRTHLIAMLDFWTLGSTEKAHEIEHLHNNWLSHKAKDSAFEWFADKKEGAKRCSCAWEWLEKNQKSISIRQLPISNYEELLIYFDRANLGQNEQKAIIQQIKKRWNRQQFDERAPDKKQCNVMLTIKTIDLLDKLGDTHRLKRAQVLERLITMESEIGMYLDDA
ncbi:hypothetical protein [Pseudomonas paeninsulae]|uniref:hypothetical protein n=1 Tax=Pseudomonas paeninsulae TaxID=3110772 RepID=UPI002D7986DB|nr:hypothetical protein [Pseudomonas sp. IT1137]